MTMPQIIKDLQIQKCFKCFVLAKYRYSNTQREKMSEYSSLFDQSELTFLYVKCLL